MSARLFDDPSSGVGSVDIRHGHATDLISEVETFDLLATDPPYAMGGEGAEHAIGAVVATTLREAGHRLAPGGWAVVYAASSWRSTYYMVEALRGVLTPVRTATWVKPQARSKVRTPGWTWASVNVLLFKKGPPKKSWGEAADALDWIECPPVMKGRRAELPPEVARWSIAPFVLEGGTMLDPFAGSGALCHAAAGMGMKAIGFEANP